MDPAQEMPDVEADGPRHIADVLEELLQDYPTLLCEHDAAAVAEPLAAV